MKSKGHAVNLNIENISADHLSMETLLSLTSKRAGEWFKEELRELGGLDHLVKTMSDCVGFLMADEISVWTEQLQNKLRKAGRVLKVLESVTQLFDIVLHCLFVMPDYLPVEKRFDVQVLTLTLVINLMEHCEENRDLILKAFLPQKEQKTEQEVIDETVAKLLQKAGRHMEDTLIASYITLIIGYLIYDDKVKNRDFT